MNQLSKDYAGQDPINTNLCERVLGAVLDSRSRTVNGTDLCTNIYDVRLEDTLPACGMNWPPDLAGVTKYLGRSDVVAALHATEKPTAWEECKGRVHQEMFNKNSKSAHLLLPGLLEKIEVLLFAGDQDFICNYMGIEAMIAALEWNGAKGLGVSSQSIIFIAQPLILATDRANPIMVRQRHRRRDLGQLPKPDLRQDLQRLAYGRL
jgi:carboxypeptidase D